MPTAFKYGNADLHAFSGVINLLADDIKVALLTSAYVPNQDTHQYFADVSANEAAGTGYTAGGQSLTTKTLTYDAATNRVKFDADDASWANSTITARYAVVYDNTPATNKPLLALVTFDADESSSNGTFAVQWSADGIFGNTAA